MKDMIWIANDGRAIPIHLMETHHVWNCIFMICRRWPWRREYFQRLIDEIRYRETQ